MVEEGASQGDDETQAGTPTAFDAAVSEFLAYPPSPSDVVGAMSDGRLRGTSLQGYRHPALSIVERVLAMDGQSVRD